MPMLSAPDCDLVPAKSEHDTFLKHLFFEIQRQANGQLPLPPDVLRDFLGRQFEAQATSYTQHFPAAQNMILMRRGDAIGRLLVDLSGTPLHIVDLAVLPACQSKGLGAQAIQAVLDHAAETGCDVSLRVLEGQRAQALYARLGFRVSETEQPYTTMVWSPVQDTTML